PVGFLWPLLIVGVTDLPAATAERWFYEPVRVCIYRATCEFPRLCSQLYPAPEFHTPSYLAQSGAVDRYAAFVLNGIDPVAVQQLLPHQKIHSFVCKNLGC